MTTDSLPTSPPAAARGFGLTLRIAAVLTVASLALFASAGFSEASVRAWIRATARASLALFLMTFVARPLVQLWGGGAARWLLANRRYLGVAAAYAQLLHGFAIAWLITAWPESYQANVVTLVGGGLGFALYFAMAATSSDAAQAALGRRAWRALHTAGAYWIWVIFASTNWGNVQHAFSGALGAGHRWLYAGIQAALVAALGLRLAARLRRPALSRA